ncbi:hypothetical protein LINPERHAP2_LOCUS9599 [Linum perenne]
MAVSLANRFRQPDSLVKSVSELKQTAIFFLGSHLLRSTSANSLFKFDQQADTTDTMSARTADEALASLKELARVTFLHFLAENKPKLAAFNLDTLVLGCNFGLCLCNINYCR